MNEPSSSWRSVFIHKRALWWWVKKFQFRRPSLAPTFFSTQIDCHLTIDRNGVLRDWTNFSLRLLFLSLPIWMKKMSVYMRNLHARLKCHHIKDIPNYVCCCCCFRCFCTTQEQHLVRDRPLLPMPVCMGEEVIMKRKWWGSADDDDEDENNGDSCWQLMIINVKNQHRPQWVNRNKRREEEQEQVGEKAIYSALLCSLSVRRPMLMIRHECVYVYHSQSINSISSSLTP